MLEIILATGLLAFLAVLLGAPYARKYLLSSGIYGIDQQKPEKPKVATSGGTVVLFGILFSVSAVLGLSGFLGYSLQSDLLLASLCSINIIALIGLIDDIHVGEGIETESPTDQLLEVMDVFGSDVSFQDGEMDRIGLNQFTKMVFVLPAVFPLMAVGAGSWIMHFPVIGTVNWGLIYPLVLMPIGLLFVSNVVNMLAGTNGLSSGMSLVAALGLGTFAFLNGRMEAAVIASGLAGALSAFMLYNWHPASILPGDSLTYLAGAGLFSVIVIGDIEKFGVFIFLPWFAEFFLKLRSGFDAHSWGELNPDGTLSSFHDSTYSLTHIFMDRNFNEEEITLALIIVECLVVALGLYLFQVLGL